MKTIRHSIPIFAALLSVPAHSEALVWNFGGQAMAIGTGCSPENLMILAAGSEVSVVLSEFGIDLEGEFAPTSARTQCSVRIPILLARDHYIGDIKHVIRYGVTKSANATGQFSVRLSVLDAPAVSFQDRFPSQNPMDEPLIERVLSQDLRIMRGQWCSQAADTVGEIRLQLNMDARRPSTRESIVVAGVRDGEGLQFGWDAFDVHSCHL